MRRGLGATLLAAAGYALLAPSDTLANVIGIDLGVDFMKVKDGKITQRTVHAYCATSDCQKENKSDMEQRQGSGCDVCSAL